MRIKYNAPVTLSFAFISAAVLGISQIVSPDGRFMLEYFAVDGNLSMNWSSPLDWLNLVSYALGHADWSHLLGNFSFILLLGPGLEKDYGRGDLLIMMGITALATGLLNALFFPSMLLGASGIVFMMILLSSFTNVEKGEIPLTFILIVLLYIGQQVFEALADKDEVSQFAHIIGGIIGSAFGFIMPRSAKAA
jgi:membrane associated rhomboid family serine protease